MTQSGRRRHSLMPALSMNVCVLHSLMITTMHAAAAAAARLTSVVAGDTPSV